MLARQLWCMRLGGTPSYRSSSNRGGSARRPGLSIMVLDVLALWMPAVICRSCAALMVVHADSVRRTGGLAERRDGRGECIPGPRNRSREWKTCYVRLATLKTTHHPCYAGGAGLSTRCVVAFRCSSCSRARFLASRAASFCSLVGLGLALTPTAWPGSGAPTEAS